MIEQAPDPRRIAVLGQHAAPRAAGVDQLHQVRPACHHQVARTGAQHLLGLGMECLQVRCIQRGRGGERLQRGLGAGQLAIDGLHQGARHVQVGALDAGPFLAVGMDKQRDHGQGRRDDEGG